MNTKFKLDENNYIDDDKKSENENGRRYKKKKKKEFECILNQHKHFYLHSPNNPHSKY